VCVCVCVCVCVSVSVCDLETSTLRVVKARLGLLRHKKIRLIFTTEQQCFYCAVQNGYLNVFPVRL